MTTPSHADAPRGMEFLYSLRRLKGRDVPTEVLMRPRHVTEAVRARVHGGTINIIAHLTEISLFDRPSRMMARRDAEPLKHICSSPIDDEVKV